MIELSIIRRFESIPNTNNAQVTAFSQKNTALLWRLKICRKVTYYSMRKAVRIVSTGGCCILYEVKRISVNEGKSFCTFKRKSPRADKSYI